MATLLQPRLQLSPGPEQIAEAAEGMAGQHKARRGGAMAETQLSRFKGCGYRLQVQQPIGQGFHARQQLATLQQAAHRLAITAAVLHHQHRPALGRQAPGPPAQLIAGATKAMAEQQPVVAKGAPLGPPEFQG